VYIYHYCNKQDIECRVVQLESKFSNIYFLAICLYRAPTGDFRISLKKEENILNYLYKPEAGFVICGDINIDYLTETYHKQCLNSVLTFFNLMPIRIRNYFSTATNNVPIDRSKKDHISIEVAITWLSDHETQFLFIKKYKINFQLL
jgi:hypothetical protein